MKLVVQRVNHACVRVNGEVIGKIGRGLCVLAGVNRYDTGQHFINVPNSIELALEFVFAKCQIENSSEKLVLRYEFLK